MKRLAMTSAKVLATLAVITGIAWIIVGDTDELEVKVQEADADLYWMNAGKDTKHTKFVNSIRDYGFEAPQTYLWNGVNMSVARKTTEMSPQEVLYDMQAHFFKAGINNDVFSRPTNPEVLGDPDAKPGEKLLAAHMGAEFVAGAMIPVADRADYTAMVGVDTAGNAEDYVAFVEKASKARSSDDIFNATRYVEAFRDGSDRNTTVLAIWSDRELKVSQLTPDGVEHRQIEDMPVCMGCDVTSQVEGRGDQSGFIAMTLESRDTPEGVLQFYKRALPTRGWLEDNSAALTQRALRETNETPIDHTATFNKDNRSLTVQSYWDETGRRSRVSLFSSPN